MITNLFRRFSLFLFIILLPFTLPADDSDTYGTDLQKVLDNVLAQYNIPGGILLVRFSDGSEWSGVSGVAQVNEADPDKYPMQENYRFRIASITKTFTGTVILQLAQEGKLSLDDKIEKWLGSDVLKKKNKRIRKATIRQLLNHSTGLYHIGGDDELDDQILADRTRTWTPQELVDIANNHKPYFRRPGSNARYSDTDYIILGMIMEKVTGETAKNLITSRIIEPLGLTNTFFPGSSSTIPGEYSHGYANKSTDHISTPSDDVTEINQSSDWTAGAMISNADNLLTWLGVLLDGSLLNEEYQEERFSFIQDKNMGEMYGLGICNSSGAIGHDGGTNGFNTAMFRYNNVDIIAMTNVECVIDEDVECFGASEIMTEALKLIFPDPGNTYNVARGTQFTISADDVNKLSIFEKKPCAFISWTDEKGNTRKKNIGILEKHLDFPLTQITCVLDIKLPAGTYNLYIQPKTAAEKKWNPILITRKVIVNSPEITNISPVACSAGDTVTLTGTYFGTDKPQVFLTYPDPVNEEKTLRSGCKVTSFSMDENGNSSLEFIIPKNSSGVCTVNMKNQSGNATSELNVTRLKPIANFEGGTLYKVGTFNIVKLKGSFYQMGRQYGGLLKKQLNDCYTRLINTVKEKNAGLTEAEIIEFCKDDSNYIPERFMAAKRGASEASGLSLDQLEVLDSVEDVVEKYLPFTRAAGGNCSGIAVWGDYTKDGSLILGRNYDEDPTLNKLVSDYMTVTVYNPDDSDVSVATVEYPGVICSSCNSINNSGIFYELNDALASTPKSFNEEDYDSVIEATTSLFSFVLDSANIEQLNGKFFSTIPEVFYLINAGDTEGAYSYEWNPIATRKRSPVQEGLLVGTNHYVDNPDFPLVFDEGKTLARRENLLDLGKKYKGQFDVGKMMNVLDTFLLDGGATEPLGTLYQVIFSPSELKIWLKAQDIQNWTVVDLNPLFDKRSE